MNQVIVSGLAGTAIGLLFGGTILVLCLFLERRRTKHWEEYDARKYKDPR